MKVVLVSIFTEVLTNECGEIHAILSCGFLKSCDCCLSILFSFLFKLSEINLGVSLSCFAVLKDLCYVVNCALLKEVVVSFFLCCVSILLIKGNAGIEVNVTKQDVVVVLRVPVLVV